MESVNLGKNRLRRMRRRFVCGAIVWLWANAASAFEMEMGAVTVQDTFTVPAWTNVTFLQPFATMPLVFALPTTDGSDPATLRIRNVTTTGFQILQVEPNANDGPHVAMPTAYLAIEPGNHTLPDGSQIAAFAHATTSFANRFISTTWDTVAYPAPFAAAPAVLASIQTMNNESQSPPTTSSTPFMDVGIRNVGNATLQVTLERAESSAGFVTSAETIGILVVDNLVNFNFVDALGNNVHLQSLATAQNIRGFNNGCFSNSYAVAFAGTPLAVASTNTRSGNNGGWLRRCSQSAAAIGLTVDEDIDADSERNHTGESAGVVAASIAFHANFDVDLLVAKNVMTGADPVGGASGPYAIPDATMEYIIAVENRGSRSPDTDSVFVNDDIPGELRLCVTATCLPGGPVVLDTSGSPVPPGVSIGQVEYSDNGGLTYTYSPTPDADGYDAAVNSMRITLDGTLASIDTAGAPSFELRFAARVN